MSKINVIVGGGAAGFFGAIACAKANPNATVILLEKMKQTLSKVKISGGGRCNVTHHCFDVGVLITRYPRGGKELQGAFSRFQPRDTVAWFKSCGVSLKTESDGRMFPTTDSSETIVSCLQEQIRLRKVDLRKETGVIDCQVENGKFILSLSNGELLPCDHLLIATGGAHKLQKMLETLGHTLIPQVPSLFTFNVPDSSLLELSGISAEHVKLTLPEFGLIEEGPLLLTHWGFSGPAVLRLSAWGARLLHEKQYKTPLTINWLPKLSDHDLFALLEKNKQTHAGRLIAGEPISPLPKNLWKKLLITAGIPQEQRFSHLSKQQLRQLVQTLHTNTYLINGKSTYKDEFVTCGGIKLSEVNFKTMESRLCPGLYFAGEILDIDGITGGYNFQNAWTTSWIAGNAMAKY